MYLSRLQQKRIGVATLLGCLLLAAQISVTLPFIADDALISLRYSERFIDGRGLTFTDGERVEGYSNLLHVLWCAALGALGFDLIHAARIVGAFGGALAIGGMALIGSSRSTTAAIAGAVLMGSSLALGHWVVGGLEQPLLAGMLALGTAALLQAEQAKDAGSWRWFAGAALALGCLTRPDAPIFVVVAALWTLPHGLKAAAKVAAPGVVAVLGQLTFRLAYYGDWVPNTAHAKLALTMHRVETGFAYVGDGLPALSVLILVAAVGLYRATPRERWLLSGLTVSWLAYVVFIGGDIFPARRHLVPVLVPLCGLSAIAFTEVRPAWLAVVALLAGSHAGLQDTQDKSYRAARLEAWEWECAQIAEGVGQAFRYEAPLLATNAAGCWPYFSKLPSLDMLGLTDAHIGKHDTPLRGVDYLGHELGDGAYVLSREPDLVIWGTWVGYAKPGYFGDQEMAQDPRFAQHYRLVRFQRGHVSALIWIRKSSPSIGPEEIADGIVIPAHLFGKQGPGVVTHIGPDFSVRTLMMAKSRTHFELEVPPGTWRINPQVVGTARISVSGGAIQDGRTTTFEGRGRMGITLIAESDVAIDYVLLEKQAQSASQDAP